MKFIFIFIYLIFSLGCFQGYKQSQKVSKDSILFLEIKGIITSEVSQTFMRQVRKYMSKEKVKGLLLRMDSPGGTVGASQEINSTLKEIRSFYKKPVVVSAGDTMASGGIYSAMSADQIVVNRGSLLGSIGVLMMFKNAIELIRWAKMDIYYIKAGEFKDSGSPFRQMTLRERELFENLMDRILEQFRDAIVEGRGLDPKVVDSFADGRIFTGEQAVEMGLADKIGTLNEAVKLIGSLTGLGSDPVLFKPVKQSPFSRYFGLSDADSKTSVSDAFKKIFNFYQLSGKPLYIMPSYIGSY